MEDNKTIGEFKLNEIYNVNSYDAIKKIPSKSIDLIVTDPPYEIETQGGNTNIGKSLKNGLMDEFSKMDITNGINYEILNQFMRVLKNIYIWCNKKQVIDYLDFFVTKNGCSFEIMVWCKTNPTPLCGGNYLIDKEFCLYFRKGIKLNTTFKTAFTYWIEEKNTKDKYLYTHPTIKPIKIIKTLIENSTKYGDVVFDPFNGSGTTCVASKELGRNYIGFEIDEKYFNIAIDRLNGITAQERKILELGQMSLFD